METESAYSILVGISSVSLSSWIAVIGCLEGFKVSGSAQSVGEHTTTSVVHSIVVILLDALAALFFSGDGLVSQDNLQVIIQVRDLCNRFGAQAVHEHLDPTSSVAARSSAWSAAPAHRQVGAACAVSSACAGRPPAACGCSAKTCCNCWRSAAPWSNGAPGVLFQQGALFSLTVVENVALPLIENAGLPRADAEHLAWSSWPWLAGLANAGDKYPASLSGGMIKRAAGAGVLWE